MAPKKLTIDDYDITEDGYIINKITGHRLLGQPNGKGYLRVSIGGKLFFIHRLVAEKFIPNPENKDQVNHINGNKLDNRVSNLEWVSNQENRTHAVKYGLHLSGERCDWSKLTQENVNYIRQHPEISTNFLANLYNVSPSTIRDVKSYRTWKNS